MSYLTFHSCQRTCENIKTPTFKSKLILAPSRSVWSWYEIENYKNLEPHSFGSTQPISESLPKMKLILNHQSLWLPSLEIRDFDRSHQIALITINDFFKLQVFCNKIIFSYADSWNALNFFKSPWPTLTKAQIMFFSLFSVHHTVFWLVDV